jgi:N-acetylglucosamine-6-phosphate deacetylase
MLWRSTVPPDDPEQLYVSRTISPDTTSTPLYPLKTSLFDIQVNGFAGVDFQQSDLAAADLRFAVDRLAAHETNRFFLTLITDSVDSLGGKFRNAEKIRKCDPTVADAICGYHLEGPWLSALAGYRGAHDPQFMGPPQISDFERLQDAAGGHIKLITLAPELPGSEKFISHVVRSGVHVSLGHTNATTEDVDRAIAAGAQFCTHLGNGVPLEMHRHDNVTQRLLACDDLTAFFIPDGIHLPPGVLKNFFRAKPPGKALFTTDCMSAAGAAPGRYRIAHWEVEVGDDRIVRASGSKTFAGSALSPDEGVRNLKEWLGLSDQEARGTFSTQIASAFGITLPETSGESR